MSVFIQSQVWQSALSGTSMLVMQALADCADDDGFAYPSVAFLAWKTGLSRSTVQAILGAFRDANQIIGEFANGSGSTKYRIVTSNLPVKEPWQRLKGRQIGSSGRPETPPEIRAGSSDPAQSTEAPCPNDSPTLPGLPECNKEEPSVKHHRNIKSSRGTRIPNDFAVTDDHRAFAKRENLPPPEQEIEKFRDYWMAAPGAKGVKLDWDATFRNWLRNSQSYGRQNGKYQSKTEQRQQQAISERDRAHQLIDAKYRTA